jgi:hypothetical protein
VLPPPPAAPPPVVQNEVVTFAQLFVKESRVQEDKENKGKDDIVITDTACKP